MWRENVTFTCLIGMTRKEETMLKELSRISHNREWTSSSVPGVAMQYQAGYVK